MLSLIKRITPQIGLWLLVFFTCAALQWIDLGQQLRYDRWAIAKGDWLRLISANFIHLNSMHLLLNMAGLTLVAVFFSRYINVYRWLIVVALTSLGVTAGLYWFNPNVIYYVGFSGVLHGLFAVGSISEIKRFPLSGWLFLLLLIAKLVWEQLNGAMPGSESMINGKVLVDSHLYGFIAGLISLLFIRKIIR